MKSIIIVTVTLLAIVAISAAFMRKSIRDTETQPYAVLKKYDAFEVRKYDSALYTSVNLNTDTYDKTSGTGFRVLAGYIFGGNEENKKIAMTSPVSMEIDDTSKMSFLVPAGLSMEDMPKPTNKDIYFEKKEAKIMAAIEFGGWADDAKIESYKKKLVGELLKNNIQFVGKFAYLGYNPPFDLINRRNEIVVELVDFKN